MVGGSADLTGSTIRSKVDQPLARNDYSGRYIYYGIREFGMAAAMNGMALHGRIILTATLSGLSDYCRNAIDCHRSTTACNLRMTHDSIGLVKTADASADRACHEFARHAA
jgi:transketolase